MHELSAGATSLASFDSPAAKTFRITTPFLFILSAAAALGCGAAELGVGTASIGL